MKKVAVILSGCGYLDGAEITEAISTLIAIGQNGAAYEVFAPNKDVEETNHLTQKPTGQKRNVLQESARIARGEIQPLEQLKAKDFDALAFPGGFGAALHLCDFGEKGSGGHIDPQVARIVKEFSDSQKPIAAICIAPAIMALAFGKKGVNVTIGDDAGTASELEKTGAKHQNCAVEQYVVDHSNKVITTPAYMYGSARPHQIFAGVSGAIAELMKMA
ncbi:isoprenoid biosynthesis glyoxalase ElbB [Candidatus Nitrospira neomarina]|uniref:Isoprenoid biosynthesis glyoxalase ElbB n=1 Tax=Candidatus Nitrospira neomarina TaxID=3020899 RepID=A0AA96GHF0_9BACT|nr:isoprenoid biosynthesis glyoxalase ElbB [Candidatus Nitrospira neomarina]WNM62439.1 isoprenoid biosynthesis glyoxalase ElbB [Candidatus Nitrospira neomarina]